MAARHPNVKVSGLPLTLTATAFFDIARSAAELSSGSRQSLFRTAGQAIAFFKFLNPQAHALGVPALDHALKGAGFGKAIVEDEPQEPYSYAAPIPEASHEENYRAAGIVPFRFIAGELHILLGSEHRKGGAGGRPCLNTVSGRREWEDDDAAATAAREFWEETGQLVPVSRVAALAQLLRGDAASGVSAGADVTGSGSLPYKPGPAAASARVAEADDAVAALSAAMSSKLSMTEGVVDQAAVSGAEDRSCAGAGGSAIVAACGKAPTPADCCGGFAAAITAPALAAASPARGQPGDGPARATGSCVYCSGKMFFFVQPWAAVAAALQLSDGAPAAAAGDAEPASSCPTAHLAAAPASTYLTGDAVVVQHAARVQHLPPDAPDTLLSLHWLPLRNLLGPDRCVLRKGATALDARGCPVSVGDYLAQVLTYGQLMPTLCALAGMERPARPSRFTAATPGTGTVGGSAVTPATARPTHHQSQWRGASATADGPVVCGRAVGPLTPAVVSGRQQMGGAASPSWRTPPRATPMQQATPSAVGPYYSGTPVARSAAASASAVFAPAEGGSVMPVCALEATDEVAVSASAECTSGCPLQGGDTCVGGTPVEIPACDTTATESAAPLSERAAGGLVQGNGRSGEPVTRTEASAPPTS